MQIGSKKCKESKSINNQYSILLIDNNEIELDKKDNIVNYTKETKLHSLITENNKRDKWE